MHPRVRYAIWIITPNSSFVLGILRVENVPGALLGVLPCGGLLSETVRGPAQLMVFLEQLSLPFLTITRLFILLCLYPQPNLIPSASLCFVLLLFCYNLFNFWKWKKFERRKFCFFPLNFYDISDFLLHGAWMYNMSGIDTISFLFNWGLLSYGVLCSHLLKAILMQQKKLMIAQKASGWIWHESHSSEESEVHAVTYYKLWDYCQTKFSSGEVITDHTWRLVLINHSLTC